MRAVELSLAHICYRVDVDSIKEEEIDSLIMYDNRRQIRVTFFGDKKLYFPKCNAKNIYNTIYFSKEEAEAAQKDKRLKMLIAANKKMQKSRLEYNTLQNKYGTE